MMLPSSLEVCLGFPQEINAELLAQKLPLQTEFQSYFSIFFFSSFSLHEKIIRLTDFESANLTFISFTKNSSADFPDFFLSITRRLLSIACFFDCVTARASAAAISIFSPDKRNAYFIMTLFVLILF